MSVSGFYIGKKTEGAIANKKLLTIAHAVGIPDADKRRILANLAFCMNDESAAVILAAPGPSERPLAPNTSEAPQEAGPTGAETQTSVA
jgi:hypothetical protein